MNIFIRRYLNALVFILTTLVFTLWALLYPHITFGDSPFVMFGSASVHGVVDLYLARQPLYFFLFVMAPLLLMGHVTKKVGIKKEQGTYFARFANVLSIVNNYFFVLSLGSVFALVKTVRGPLAIIYLIIFILNFALMIFENVFKLGYLDAYFPERDLAALEKQNDLAATARFERLEAKTGTFYFFLAVSAVLGVIFFIYPLVTEMFTIPLGGDYTQQQIPFYTNGYDDWWHFIKTGEFPLWDYNTFLGVNNVGSNSFYYALNPFFLPILLFPRDLIPQGLAILMIGKFVLAAVTMRMYLKYLGVNEKEARFFAIIYAFCGWNAYYLWFNHFMEVAVIFPLIFLGIEKVLKEKKITLLIFALGLMGFANYFFLVTVAIIGVLYAGFRYFQQIKEMTPSVIGLGVLAFALGILLSSVVLFPSLAIALNSDRATDTAYFEQLKLAFNVGEWKKVWEIMTKWEALGIRRDHKKYYPLISYFFPVLSNRSVALFATSSYDNTISSIFTFSPVILLFIPAMVNSFKKKKVSHFIAIGFFLFALFTPIFYNALHGFTTEYGRWQLIVPFSLITYVATSLPEIRKQKAVVFDLSFLINLIAMAFTVQIAYSYENRNGFSLMEEREYIIYYQFIMLFISYIAMRFSRNHKSEYYLRSLLVFFEIAVMGTVTMIGHGFISYRNHTTGGLANYNADYKVARKIESLDHSYYRIYNTNAKRGNENLAMRADYNGLSTFHSLYNFELMTFNEWSRINHNYNGWSLAIFERRIFLYDFLQVKYYVLNDNDNSIAWSGGKKTYAPFRNIPNHYTFNEDLSSDNRFVYQVDEAFNVGFGVSDVISYEKRDVLTDEIIDLVKTSATRGQFIPIENEELYLNAALLSLEDRNAVVKAAPSLGTKTYAGVNRKSYERLNYANGLDVDIYEFSTPRYPYEAQLRAELNSSVVLPTPEFVETNGTKVDFNSAPRLLDGSKHVVEYTKSDGTNLLDGAGQITINLPFFENSEGAYRYRVFLYDENYELITFDDHLNIFSASSSWKTLRSFHSPKSVKKIALVPIGNRTFKLATAEHVLFIYEQDVINSIRENSLVNSLQDVVVSTNTISFTTNYPARKFVVTSIPYDPGWQVVSSDDDGKDVKHDVYKVQGGFAGFLSASGETEYVMSFTPTHFNMGLLLSFSALAITLLLELSVRTYKKRKALAAIEEEILSA